MHAGPKKRRLEDVKSVVSDVAIPVDFCSALKTNDGNIFNPTEELQLLKKSYEKLAVTVTGLQHKIQYQQTKLLLTQKKITELETAFDRKIKAINQLAYTVERYFEERGSTVLSQSHAPAGLKSVHCQIPCVSDELCAIKSTSDSLSEVIINKKDSKLLRDHLPNQQLGAKKDLLPLTAANLSCHNESVASLSDLSSFCSGDSGLWKFEKESLCSQIDCSVLSDSTSKKRKKL